MHALVLDGVYARAPAGALQFHVAPAPSAADMADILTAIVPAVRRLLARHGLDAEDVTAADPFAEATPVLAGLAAASVRGLAASGGSMHEAHRRGAQREPDGATPEPRACQARWEAFDLHAGVRVPAGHRDRLERRCRYALRPPLADERLHRTPSGDVASACSVSSPSRGWRWADLMRRVFELDVLACPRCGGRLRLVAVLEASEATKRILRHFHLPTEVPPPAPARAPPGVDDWAA